MPASVNHVGPGWPRSKSLALIPELFRITLAYGRNPLTGKVWWEGNDRWMVRNVIRWVRSNPPVGALGDKFRPATSELVVFTRNPKRYFDLDAVRHPNPRALEFSRSRAQMNRGAPGFHTDGDDNNAKQNQGGAPPLDWWKITPTGYPGAHYAVFPSELCVIPIKSMCPERVCRTCGEPSLRGEDFNSPKQWDVERNTQGGIGVRKGDIRTHRTTLGWSDCGHDDWRPGVVLDPFAGTGTTLAVATGHGRDAIGIDLDERNAVLAVDRVGPLLLEVRR